MPAIVDHDRRRRDIASAVERLVARKGMQAVTVRAVGAEAGFSSAIVGQYFKSKENLLTFTYLSARRKATERVERALIANADIFSCIRECLPIDAAREAEWQVWFGFWGMATANKVLAEERQKGASEANSLFERVLQRGQATGELPPYVDCAAQATRLQVFVNGIASIVLQLPHRWPAAAQEKALRAEIDLITATPASVANMPSIK